MHEEKKDLGGDFVYFCCVYTTRPEMSEIGKTLSTAAAGDAISSSSSSAAAAAAVSGEEASSSVFHVDYDTERLHRMMSQYKPLVPEALAHHMLKRAGFQTEDKAVLRFAAVLSRHFVENVVKDAWQFHNIRQKKMKVKQRDKTLRMRDLLEAAKDRGISVSRPEFFSE